MYYYSKKSRRKIIHTATCSCTQRFDPDTIGTFDTLQQAYQAGYRICKKCHPAILQYRKEQDAILGYCRKHGMSCSWTRTGIRVTSTVSKWIIVPTDSGKTELYHRNTKTLPSDEPSLVTGYHKQNRSFNSIIKYLKYIDSHDLYRNTHPETLPIAPKSPAKKGTKRYRKEQALQKKRQRSHAIRNVLTLIESLDSNFVVHPAIC